jgi:MSHA biogenesis protein MshP
MADTERMDPIGMVNKQQRGFSGVLVIVALVLITSLVGFGVTMLSAVQGGYSQELSSVRATQAARAGLDWARYQVLRPAAANCPALQNVAMPASLAPFTVTVSCTASGPYTEGAASVRIYQLSVTACLLPGGSPNCTAVPAVVGSDYVEKTLSTWVER